jgi:glutathione S-transferase
MSYTIIGSGISLFVRKVMVFLIEKGLPHEVEDVNPMAAPENFHVTSPLGKIPAFRHDDRIINDSSIICRYVEDLEPTPALYPGDPYDRARASWLEEYSDSGLTPFAGQKIFFPLVMTPMMTGKEPDEASAAEAEREGLPGFFDYLNESLGDAEYCVGGTFGIADLSVASTLVNLRLAGVLPDVARWPALAAFTQRAHARPSFEAANAPVKAALGKRWADYD